MCIYKAISSGQIEQVEESLWEIIDPEAHKRWRRRRGLEPNGLEIMMDWQQEMQPHSYKLGFPLLTDIIFSYVIDFYISAVMSLSM